MATLQSWSRGSRSCIARRQLPTAAAKMKYVSYQTGAWSVLDDPSKTILTYVFCPNLLYNRVSWLLSSEALCCCPPSESIVSPTPVRWCYEVLKIASSWKPTVSTADIGRYHMALAAAILNDPKSVLLKGRLHKVLKRTLAEVTKSSNFVLKPVLKPMNCPTRRTNYKIEGDYDRQSAPKSRNLDFLVLTSISAARLDHQSVED